MIDDHSADATAAIVRALAARDGRLTLVTSPALPSRWTGKSHACWIGARQVAAATTWLCFIDADVRAEPSALSSALGAAEAQRLDLLSLAPRQELLSFPERLIIPCGLMLLAFVKDLQRAQQPSAAGVTATGQFMLVRRDVYEAIGGHAAVSTAICEDLELARRIKQCGGSVLLMGGESLLTTRMYTGWRPLWLGLAKNLVDTLGGTGATLSVALSGVILAWAALVVPAIDVVAWAQDAVPTTLTLLALAASAAAFGLHIGAAVYFRVPFWYGLLFPLGYTIGALLAADSVRRRVTGRVSWKGRFYP